MTPNARQGTSLALWSLSVFLFLFPLVILKPGMPPTLKADEPAYYLMSLSLARDGDLRCETKDLERLYDEFPYQPARNLIVMSDDDWQTLFYGKPYAYSLLAAPLTALFGANGMVATNMLLLLAMIWMGTAYLSSFNPRPLAALFAVGFFLLSTAFVYVFWLHPEVFMMAATTACLFFALHRFEPRPVTGRWSRLRALLVHPASHPVWSAVALAAGTYHKPVLAAFALPALWAFWRRRGWRAVAVWLVAAALAGGLVAGLSLGLTGHASAYLSGQRFGFSVDNPEVLPVPSAELRTEGGPQKNSWFWIFRLPDIDPYLTWNSVKSFLWGRHTGLLPYMPFSFLCLLLFLLHGRRSAERWLVLAAAAAVAVFFLVFIPFNWHGGGGFVGNRYFVVAYPAFLFLVSAIRPAMVVVAGYALGGLFLSPLLFTPFGAPVREPTLQAHVRNYSFQWLPLEMSIQRRIPGYVGAEEAGAYLRGRKDQFKPRGSEFWIYGAQRAEIWLATGEKIDTAAFAVTSPARTNTVEIDLGAKTERLRFAPRDPAGEVRIVTVPTGAPELFRHTESSESGWLYPLTVRTATGRPDPGSDFFVGAVISYLGSARSLEGDASYRVEWLHCPAPSEVTAGASFEVPVELRNRSTQTWSHRGLTRVNLSYHWLDADGTLLERDGVRTRLPEAVAPGAEVSAPLAVQAPLDTGPRILEIDLVREHVAWFGERNGGRTCRASIEIVDASPETSEATPSDG